MESREIEIMGWDVDGTLLDWMGAYVPAYEAMSRAIAEYAGKSPQETTAAMKAFYTLKGKLEDEGLIQGLYEMGFFSGRAHFDEGEAIQVAKDAFSEARTEHLKVYPGIEETVHEIGKRIHQLILSDGPLIQVRKRVEEANLLTVIPHVYGTRSASVPRLPEGLLRDAHLNPDFVVSRPKPHTNLEEITNMSREEIRRGFAYAGDNRGLDMGLVEAFNATGFWAKWSGLDPTIVTRLTAFAPDGNVKKHLAGHAADKRVSSSRIFEVQDPREIPKILFGM